MKMKTVGRWSTILGALALVSNVYAATVTSAKVAPATAKGIVLASTTSAHSEKSEAARSVEAERFEVIAPDAKKAASQNTTTTNVKTAGIAQKKVSVGYLSENWVTSEDANSHNYSSFMSQNNVNISYDLAEGRTLQARQYFLYNMTDTLGKNTWGQGDFALQYTDATQKLGAAPLEAKARLYMPVAKASQDVGRYELRLTGSVTQAAGKYVNIEYAVNPRFYAYTINSDGQKGFRILPSISASYAKESATFVPYVTAYTDHTWSNTGRGISQSPYTVGQYNTAAVNTDFGDLDIGAKINLSKNVNLEMYFEEAYNLRAAATVVEPAHDYSGYYLNLSASM